MPRPRKRQKSENKPRAITVDELARNLGMSVEEVQANIGPVTDKQLAKQIEAAFSPDPGEGRYRAIRMRVGFGDDDFVWLVPEQEEFCQMVASGVPQDEAFRASHKVVSPEIWEEWVNEMDERLDTHGQMTDYEVQRLSFALMSSDQIGKRINSLISWSLKQNAVTVDRLTHMTLEAHRMAQKLKDPGTMLKSVAVLMKLHGLDTEKRMNLRTPAGEDMPRGLRDILMKAFQENRLKRLTQDSQTVEGQAVEVDSEGHAGSAQIDPGRSGMVRPDDDTGNT